MTKNTCNILEIIKKYDPRLITSFNDGQMKNIATICIVTPLPVMISRDFDNWIKLARIRWRDEPEESFQKLLRCAHEDALEFDELIKALESVEMIEDEPFSTTFLLEENVILVTKYLS